MYPLSFRCSQKSMKVNNSAHDLDGLYELELEKRKEMDDDNGT